MPTYIQGLIDGAMLALLACVTYFGVLYILRELRSRR